MTTVTDLLIVGGGINGAGIARDAVGRGLSVVLCEQGDLAGYTSSASTKLIHGGLRYLEYYEFRLVREALFERERLLNSAPHIIWPLRFILPHEKGIRPAWFVRLGLFLYDHLAPRKKLPGTEGIKLTRHPAGQALKPGFDTAFVYSDCWVEDSRMVALNAIDAFEKGADIRVRTKLVSARRDGGTWVATLQNVTTGETQEVRAKVIVNAGGPFVADVLNAKLGLNTTKNVRLVKGSHIVVPKLFDTKEAFILQNTDKRIVFAIPYQEKFTLIGTTDIPVESVPDKKVEISSDEIQYLCNVVNHFFKKQVTPADVVWTYSGVRPLFDDGSSNASAVTRDYVFDLDAPQGGAPVLSIFGGKITTFRKLAEHALEELKPFFPAMKPAWTEDAKMPGGDMPDADFDRFFATVRQRWPFLPEHLAHRLARAYGTRMEELLGSAKSMADLGEDFGAGLTGAEVDYLVRREWARTAEDILWRRSKLGLHVPVDAPAKIDAYLAKKDAAPVAAQ
ncbi:glycerol-3-phosphate dehydrogenase [Microvirga lotononidis]|uniref:Glycerol-3-phosphate dehydrogenase n=1 Tax=Microvirga lotononidis TaxID=864069 RepID=I4YNM3_9HYPH|nr:glycerol-3-phosphate dehydrogenase [Microvirga lotononidis]EIM25565.1 glycerol-3-phosphate dehydrogenase [Microvirga lotononidis]WQO26127.1 glycerol-3-phosphate dehydrogenase [Microvirga lotononidis]